MSAGKIKAVLCTILFLYSAAVCTGCTGTEVEEHNYPLAAVLDYEDGSYYMTLGMEQLADVAGEKTKRNGTSIVTEGSDCYQLFERADINNTGKTDYNHMKALILNSRILKDEALMNELLAYLEEQEAVARNTLLFVTDVPGNELMEMNEVLREAVGTYLDEMIASDAQSRRRAAVTLGTLYNTWNSKNENLYIPYLTVTEDKILFEHYYLLQGRRVDEAADKELGDMALLTEDKLKHYGVTLAGGEILKLSHIICRYEIEEESAGVTVTVHLSAEARRMDAKVENDAQQAYLAVEAEQYLEAELGRAAEELKTEYDVDISNSFYMLGGYNRAVYGKYHGDWDSYRRNVAVVYDCKIIPVNL